MKIEHKRIANVCKEGRAYCISHIYINGIYSHDAIEDYDRGLDASMTDNEISKKKVMSKTAIPTGMYTVKMNIYSNTFGPKPYYKAFCKGLMPRLDPVKGFSGILIHRGVNEDSSSGCIIVGLNKLAGRVIDSQRIFEMFYKKMKAASDKGERIEYIITRIYKA